MRHDHHQRVKTVFMEALGLDPAQRSHLLRERCADDPELRAEVEALLSFHETGGGILDGDPDFCSLDLPTPPDRPRYEPGEALVGSDIGPYRLRTFLGHGGMGLVFLAEQQQPVQRKVALKIVKSDSETTEILARFEMERQVLALMDHPCIAGIHEAGSTADGRPYFTMEHVQGIPLHEFCDRNRLTIRQRLDLLVQVCDGIQHAHQKGIIHRDLKPSNILVAGTGDQPRPKIIDFGVAKAIHLAATDTPPVTAHGHQVGTPSYMSPEQASSSGQDVDTRSDIYSLGAILYELLCGVLPLDAGDSSPAQHRILSANPDPPSRRIGQLDREETAVVARSRRTQPRGLVRQLRRDLDWIVLTALAREREQRYATVSELSADVHRYLRGEPVQAGPPSWGYRFWKYLRRNQILVTASAAVILALTVGLVTSLNFAHQSELAHQAAADMTELAQREANKAQTSSDYLESVLLQAKDDPNLTMLEAVELMELRLDEQLTDAPEVNAATHVTISGIHRSLGIYERAESHALRAVLTLRGMTDPDPELLVDALTKYGRALLERSKYDPAEEIYQEALGLLRQQLPEGDSERNPQVIAILSNLATIAGFTGSFLEAVDRYRELIAHQEKSADTSSVALGHSLLLLGHFLAADARYDEGERHLQRALAMFAAELGEEHMKTTLAKLYLGSLNRKKGDFEAARPLLVGAADKLQAQLGVDHPYLLRVQRELASTWARLGRFAAADSLFDLTLDREFQREGEPNQAVAFTLLFQGDMFRTRGDMDRALACYREVDHIANDLFPDKDHFLKAMAQHQLALAAAARGDLTGARERLEDCLGQRRKILRPTHPLLIRTIADLSGVLMRQAAFTETLPLATEYFTTASQEYGPDHAETRRAAEFIRDFCRATGETALADRWQEWLAGTTATPPLPAMAH